MPNALGTRGELCSWAGRAELESYVGGGGAELEVFCSGIWEVFWAERESENWSWG